MTSGTLPSTPMSDAGAGDNRSRHHVVVEDLAVPLCRELQRAAGRELRADAEGNAARQVVLVRIAAMPVADAAGDLGGARDFLADDEVELHVHLAGARAIVGRTRRHLHHAAERKGDRVLARFGQQIELRAEERVAELVADPSLAHEGIVVVDAAVAVAAKPEDRPRVAIDSRDEPNRAEDLGPPLHAVGERALKVGDVGEALAHVPVEAIGARRPRPVAQHLARRDEPETRVSVNTCGGGAYSLFHSRRGLSPRFAGD